MRNQFVSKYLKQAALVFFAFTIAFAQAPTSQIDGVVRDSAGLAVPAAEVRVTQTATGLVRTATSGPDGSYLFTNLPIGPYTLEAAKDGFSKFVRSGNLNVALTRTFSV